MMGLDLKVYTAKKWKVCCCKNDFAFDLRPIDELLLDFSSSLYLI